MIRRSSRLQEKRDNAVHSVPNTPIKDDIQKKVNDQPKKVHASVQKSRIPSGSSRALGKEGSERSRSEISETENNVDEKELESIANDVLDEMYRKPNAKARNVFNHWNEAIPNRTHQADILYLTQDSSIILDTDSEGNIIDNNKVFKYVLCVVDIASRYGQAKELTSFSAEDTVKALDYIYSNDTLLKRPERLNTDSGSNFVSNVFKNYCDKHDIVLMINTKGHHLSFVENYNGRLAQKLYKEQARLELMSNSTNRQWLQFLPRAVQDLNNKPMKSLKNLTPAQAIRQQSIDHRQVRTDKISEKDKSLYYPEGTVVRRLLGKDEYLNIANNSINIEKKRMTDANWTLDLYKVIDVYKPGKCSQCVYYHTLKDINTGKVIPKRYTYYQLQKSKFYNSKT